ncbi:hypothetical protein V22_13710 [Calycomorphotria hydatis]|uniref:Uncharacterized protein n=1 Tax=Calycomorphotria hydatis TaxID=2528027 RepID=A0A517T706_9PLAN|nr:hypothetical protein V22_13710 [Calycomorphotria hydatis]
MTLRVFHCRGELVTFGCSIRRRGDQSRASVKFTYSWLLLRTPVALVLFFGEGWILASAGMTNTVRLSGNDKGGIMAASAGTT